jgi:hypothetical protein
VEERCTAEGGTLIPASEFEIKNGVLISYNGNGGDIIVPDGVTAIEDDAFLRETAGEYMECVVVYTDSEGNIELSKSKGLHKLVSEEQLEEIIILIQENLTH